MNKYIHIYLYNEERVQQLQGWLFLFFFFFFTLSFSMKLAGTPRAGTLSPPYSIPPPPHTCRKTKKERESYLIAETYLLEPPFPNPPSWFWYYVDVRFISTLPIHGVPASFIYKDLFPTHLTPYSIQWWLVPLSLSVQDSVLTSSNRRDFTNSKIR